MYILLAVGEHERRLYVKGFESGISIVENIGAECQPASYSGRTRRVESRSIYRCDRGASAGTNFLLSHINEIEKHLRVVREVDNSDGIAREHDVNQDFACFSQQVNLPNIVGDLIVH